MSDLSLQLQQAESQLPVSSYFDEALFVLEFVRSHLYDPASGHILHHFIDGRIALPSDPEYFCTGCNLQFLYAVYLLQQAAVGEAP